MKTYLPTKFIVERDPERCIQCQVCVNQCTFDAHAYDPQDNVLRSRDENCVVCHRCVVFCPTGALTIRRNPLDYRQNNNWYPEYIEDIIKQAETGGVIDLRGNVNEYQLGKEIGMAPLEEKDCQVLQQCVGEFAAHFGYETGKILKHKFIKLFPRWLRPYGRLYAY